MQFEEDVSWVCGEQWRTAPQDERDGAYGVALVRAFMDGVRPSLDDLTLALELTPDEAKESEVAYRRLQATGVFAYGTDVNARRDRALQGYCSRADGRTAWCHIAGIASGWIGGGYFVRRDR